MPSTLVPTSMRPSTARSPIGLAVFLALVVALTSVVPLVTLHAQGGGARRSAPPSANPAADVEAVHRAALDYIEGFYEGDSTKHVRSIRPEFYKYGFYFSPDSGKYQGMQMTWPQALAFSRRVRENNRPAPSSAPKEVKILEVSDQTAAVKVTAYWGIDYMLLGKYDGKWMISHVIWQSTPPTP